jgi:hypothetical protein
MKKTLLSILSVASLAMGSAQSAVVFGNLGQTEADPISDSGFGLTSSRWAAVGFTLNPSPGQWYGLESVKIGLFGNGTVRLSVYSDNAGKPGVQIGTFPNAITDTEANVEGPNLVSFTLNQGTTTDLAGNSSNLTPSTQYWFVASMVSGASTWVSSDNLASPYTQYTPTWAANPGASTPSGWVHVANLVSTNSGTTWAAPTGGNVPQVQALSISVAAIPEPGTWAAMAILAGGAAFAGWRRRRQQTAA